MRHLHPPAGARLVRPHASPPGRAVAAALFAGLLAACAAGPHAAPTASPRTIAPRGARAPSDRILTGEGFAGLDLNQSLYDALQGLRPNFLSFRGAAPTVYVNGVRVASEATLRELPIRWVERVQLLAGDEATLRYGTNHTGAALLVSTRGTR
jgi:hypothetical protein